MVLGGQGPEGQRGLPAPTTISDGTETAPS
jgi:hypothetical protein